MLNDYVLFWLSIIGEIIILPIYLLSLEHIKLQKWFGLEKGVIVGDFLGMLSGWGFFLFLFGIWLSPQPRFLIPIGTGLLIVIPIIGFSIPLVHFAIFLPLIVIVLWFSFNGLKEVGLKVAETHRPDEVVTTGIYSVVRHPQYLGAFLAHLGISILLSAWYSLLMTPFIAIYVYIIAWKEEKELIHEFGQEYENYRSKVPMLIPRPKNFRKKIKKQQ